MNAPTVFVSYSWSSPEHQDWVLRLATELFDSGVEVKLDKWDLKVGHEANAFMEQMVSDPNISRVIIVSDRIYAEKSNSRKGGAGTEAEIISRELFQKQDQNKFAAVVREKYDNGDPCLPAYYTSRIYIDFTDDTRYQESFEQLLRWIYDKPLHKRPERGTRPAFLTDAEKAVSLSTGVSKRRACDAIASGKGHAYPATKEYFDVFTRELERFRLNADFDPSGDAFIANLRAFIPYRDECIEVMRAISLHSKEDRIVDLVHTFFDDFLDYLDAPEGVNQWRTIDFDNYKFFAYELFLHCCALFLSEDRPDLFNALVEEPYYLERNAQVGREPLVEFPRFCQYLQAFEIRNRQLELRRLSIVADQLKERSGGSGMPFRQLMQMDFILFLRADLSDYDVHARWLPMTLVYLGMDHRPFEIFERSRSSRYFEKVRPFLGGATKEKLEQLLGRYGPKDLYVPDWGDPFHRFAPAVLVGIERLCTRP